MKKLDWLIIASIIGLSVFLLRDLFKPAFYTSHDGIHQVVRLYYFDEALRDGQFPPRWAGGLLNGFGYPLFVFSYQLPWILAEPWLLTGFSIFTAIKMTFLLGFVLSGITMYLFLRNKFSITPATTGTLLYLIAPYRFSNIFVRAAIGDATAFIFPPLLFLSLYKIQSSKKRRVLWVVVGGWSLALLLLSHAMVFFFFLCVGFLFMAYSLFISKDRRIIAISYFMTVAVAFGISGYYLVPSFFEKNLTQFSQIMKPIFTGQTFLTLGELFYSPWAYGVMHSKEGAMSLQLGIGQWSAFVLFLVTCLFILRKKKTKEQTRALQESMFYALIFVVSILLMLPVSLPLWNVINSVVLIDFTWRVLAVSVFAVSVTAAYVLSRIRFPLLASFFLISLTLYANRNHLRINQVLDWEIPFYLLLEKTTNTYGEYTPKWVRNELVEKPKPKVQLSDTNIPIEMIKSRSNKTVFTVDAKKSLDVTIHTIYYPGWNVSANGHEVPIRYEGSGFLEFSLAPQGKTVVTATLTETPLRKASDLVSLFFILGSGIILFRELRYG